MSANGLVYQGCWQTLTSRLAFPPGQKAGVGTEPVLVTLTVRSAASPVVCVSLLSGKRPREEGGCWVLLGGGAGGCGGSARARLCSSLVRHADLCACVQCTCKGVLRGGAGEPELNDTGKFDTALSRLGPCEYNLKAGPE